MPIGKINKDKYSQKMEKTNLIEFDKTKLSALALKAKNFNDPDGIQIFNTTIVIMGLVTKVLHFALFSTIAHAII